LEKIKQLLRDNKGYGLKLNEIEFLLKLKMGGKMYLYSFLQELVEKEQIKKSISNGIEYFFID